jgi:hypothetical protein
LLASQTEIVDRLKDLENHLANTRSRFGEVEEALQSSLRDALNNRDHHSVDARIEDLRAELTHVSETVEAAVKCALESAPSLRPATREGSEPTPFALESSETSSSQTWPLQGPSKSQGVEVHPPLEILHMPTDEEMKSAVSQKPDQMTHALNHLFQPITPEEDKRTDRNDGMFLDQYPKSNGAQENRDAEGSTGPMLFMSPGSHPLPGTPGSPFPNPVPLKPTDSDSDSDSDDSKEEPNEGSSYFQKPYEPPSDHKGFRFPGWNK